MNATAKASTNPKAKPTNAATKRLVVIIASVSLAVALALIAYQFLSPQAEPGTPLPGSGTSANSTPPPANQPAPAAATPPAANAPSPLNRTGGRMVPPDAPK